MIIKIKHTNLYIILTLFIVSCKSLFIKLDEPPPPIHELTILDVPNSDSGGVTIKYFKNHHTLNNENQLVEKDFIWDSISKKMIDNGNRKPIQLLTLLNYDVKYKGLYSEEVIIKNGYLTGKFVTRFYQKKNFDTIKVIPFENGNISGNLIVKNKKDSVLYQTRFKKGKGYWKDFYYNENKLREEGKVKNNYKLGLWKYYNKLGTIDSIKTYLLKDSVDVRFPYCMFNKVDPCY